MRRQPIGDELTVIQLLGVWFGMQSTEELDDYSATLASLIRLRRRAIAQGEVDVAAEINELMLRLEKLYRKTD